MQETEAEAEIVTSNSNHRKTCITQTKVDCTEAGGGDRDFADSSGVLRRDT